MNPRRPKNQVILSVFPEGDKTGQDAAKVIKEITIDERKKQKKPVASQSDTIHIANKDKPTDQKFGPLKNLTGDDQIYLHGHGSYENDKEISVGKNKITYQELAQLLSKTLTNPELKNPNHQPRLKISLLMCESVGFAKNLHAELSKYGIYTEISARVPKLRITGAEIDQYDQKTKAKKLTHPLAPTPGKEDPLQHQPYSKVVFKWDQNNNQTMQFSHDLNRDARKIIDGIRKEIEGKIDTIIYKNKDQADFLPEYTALQNKLNAFETKLSESKFNNNDDYKTLIGEQLESFSKLENQGTYKQINIVDYNYIVSKFDQQLNNRIDAYTAAEKYNENPKYGNVLRQGVGRTSAPSNTGVQFIGAQKELKLAPDQINDNLEKLRAIVSNESFWKANYHGWKDTMPIGVRAIKNILDDKTNAQTPQEKWAAIQKEVDIRLNATSWRREAPTNALYQSVKSGNFDSFLNKYPEMQPQQVLRNT